MKRENNELADESTGSLDKDREDEILKIYKFLFIIKINMSKL